MKFGENFLETFLKQIRIIDKNKQHERNNLAILYFSYSSDSFLMSFWDSILHRELLVYCISLCNLVSRINFGRIFCSHAR